MSALQPEERQLIRRGAEDFVRDQYPFEEREKRRAQRLGNRWASFAELGWLALPFAESAGGLGGGVEDVQVLARAFGPALIEEPFTDVVLAGKVLESVQSELLPRLISGDVAVVLAHGETMADADFEFVRCRATRVPGGFHLQGCKRAVPQAGAAEWLLISAVLQDQPALFVVEAQCPGVSLSEFPTIDSRLAADIDLDKAFVAEAALLASGEAAARAVREAILYSFAVLVGEARGIADVLVEKTADYLGTREQFGVKLAEFQALQHKLADMVIGAEEIRSMEWLVAGVVELDDAHERERVLRSAKARVGRLSRSLGETAVQLHGGMGVSDELVIGHYLRRAIAIDGWYGDSSQQLAWLAAHC